MPTALLLSELDIGRGVKTFKRHKSSVLSQQSHVKRSKLALATVEFLICNFLWLSIAFFLKTNFIPIYLIRDF